MPTFGQIAKGTRARPKPRGIVFRARINPATGEWESDEGGTITALDVRPINPIEHTTIVEKARAFAISKGVEAPKDGDELYEDAKILHTLVIACIDKDSPEKDPRPFFEGGFDQLHGTELLLPDHIGYLYEQQQLWQDQCSPRFTHQTPGQFMAAVVKAAGGDQSFFVGARPGMRWDFTRTLAAAWLNLTTLKSRTSSDSSPSTPSTAIPAE
jgi:hypothetical protein